MKYLDSHDRPPSAQDAFSELFERRPFIKKLTGANRHFWSIRGFDGLDVIFECKVDFGQISEDQIQRLLKALAGKAGLTYAEIVGAYSKRRTRVANNLLAIQKDGVAFDYSCGTNPYFTATVVDNNGKTNFARAPSNTH